MQTDHKTNGGRGASLSRRKFFQIAAAGTAAALPVATEAATAEIARLPLTEEQQLEACIGQLRNILQRMHPKATLHYPHYFSSREDGSFRLSIQSDVVFQQFNGAGLYEVSMDGYLMVFWLEKECRVSRSTGKPIPGMEIYHAQYWEDGAPTQH
ncbi:hypothetical protein [Rhizobium leguminosarum]|uniref:hypothetical protein n=1 Tax=Rhizobium leguminosarum TaxID=384 RepID=UPI003F95BA95